MNATKPRVERRTWSGLLHIAAAACACALLAGCAAFPLGEPDSTASSEDPAGYSRPRIGPGASTMLLRVSEVQGGATVTRKSHAITLHKGDGVAPGEPVQVAKGGFLRFALGDQGLIELGSGARLIADKLPSSALLGARQTGLRLEKGYLRLVWSEPTGFRDWPLDVSMSRWSGALKPGEYFFEADDDNIVACSTTGEVRLTGNPDTLPAAPSACAALRVGKPARLLDADEKQWAAARATASLRAITTEPAAAPAPATAAVGSPAAASAAPTKGAAKSAAAKRPSTPPESVKLVVASATGASTIRRRSGEVALRKGSTVVAGQPVQVGARSRVSLSVPDRGWIDLGPSTRFVVHKLPDATSGGSQETWMRLEHGTVRVAVTGTTPGSVPPPELSFSRWAAKLGDGEYFIESAKDAATACVAKGDLQLSGVPESLPQTMSQPCVRLRASQPPVLVTPSETAWSAIRSGSSIEVALALPVPAAPVAAAPVAVAPVAVAPRSVPAPTPAPVVAPAPTPAPAITTATMPSAPRGIGVNPPPAELPKTPTPTFQPPPAPNAPTIAAAAPPADARPPAPAPIETAPTAVPPQPAPLEMETPTAAGTGAASSASAETAAATAAPSSSADSTTLAMATPPSSTGGRPEWLVNVDSFADPTRAQQLLDVLKGAGYPAALRTQLVQGVPSYRVVIPGLSTESEANTVVSDLEQHFELTSAWVLRTQ